MAGQFTEESTAIYEMGHIGGVAAELVLMLARAAGLPEPTSISVYGIIGGYVHDQVSLQFPGQADSAEALAMWATMFGGVITSSTKDTKDGPQLWVKTSFPWMHLRVEAFTHIPLPEPEATKHADRCHCTPDTAPCDYDGPHELPPF
jgi:hypothetical protein